MGMSITATFPNGPIPEWPTIRGAIEATGLTVAMRMINGELAAPNEEPPPGWSEVRVGTPAGMVTIQRADAALNCVIWGNADAELQKVWRTIAQACADAGNGRVEN